MNLHLPYKLLLLSLLYSVLVGYLYWGNTFAQSPLITTISVAVIFLGLVLGFWVKRTILSHRTTLNPYGTPSALIVSGPFRLSRNPMYLSYVLVAVGVSVFAQTLLAYLGPLAYFLYLHYRAIPLEEKNLRRLFPDDYLSYTERVRKWL